LAGLETITNTMVLDAVCGSLDVHNATTTLGEVFSRAGLHLPECFDSKSLVATMGAREMEQFFVSLHECATNSTMPKVVVEGEPRVTLEAFVTAYGVHPKYLNPWHPDHQVKAKEAPKEKDAASVSSGSALTVGTTTEEEDNATEGTITEQDDTEEENDTEEEDNATVDSKATTTSSMATSTTGSSISTSSSDQSTVSANPPTCPHSPITCPHSPIMYRHSHIYFHTH
jgi:hypothetical protein